MPYTVQQLATLAGVSTRTLHYYDEIGLLIPSRVKNNGYRYYEEDELLRLQQILFFRELEFPLEEIKRIMSSPAFDMSKALKDHRKLIELKKERLSKLIETIDKTLKKINKKITMDDQELYGNFTKEEMEKYSEEAKERWGHTDAWKQSQERVKEMGKDGLKKALDDSKAITLAIAECMKAGLPASDAKTQKHIAEHYTWLRNFYEPGLEMYRGLGEMYVADERFTKTYEDIAPGLAQYMRDGMVAFADNGGEDK